MTGRRKAGYAGHRFCTFGGSVMPQALPGLLLLALFGFTPVLAQEEPVDTSAGEMQVTTPWDTAHNAMIRGPAAVPLRDQATLDVPDGFGFVPLKESQAVMRVMGNQTDERFIGLVFPLSDDDQYFITLNYEDSGYIKDDEAKDWDADELLQSLKDGTEAGNEEREKLGIDPIKVTRWVEPPAYDAGSHRLVWSAEAVLKRGEDPDPTINYNTYVLGREGYISANLITNASTVAADRQDTSPLLRAVNFNEKKRYTDFDSSTDAVAAYGLTALVGGIAAKKLGLLAVMAAFVVKFAKVIFVAVVALLAGARKFFGSKPDATP
jgi:uncharacterized membrane-anchored protein